MKNTLKPYPGSDPQFNANSNHYFPGFVKSRIQNFNGDRNKGKYHVVSEFFETVVENGQTLSVRK